MGHFLLRAEVGVTTSMRAHSERGYPSRRVSGGEAAGGGRAPAVSSQGCAFMSKLLLLPFTWSNSVWLKQRKKHQCLCLSRLSPAIPKGCDFMIV